MLEAPQIFKLLDSVVAQIKHVQIWKSIQIFDRSDEILTENEGLELLKYWHFGDFWYLVVRNVEEGEIG